MASLTEQMELLQKQQAVLAQQIKEEEERNKKLGKEASIERLEALIEPITHHLDDEREHFPGSKNDTTYRQELEHRFVLQSNQSAPPTKYQSSHMLANEEIFVTLLNIIKKQDARIEELEKGNKVENKHMKRASTIEFSDLQMLPPRPTVPLTGKRY